MCALYLWFLAGVGEADWRWDDTQILAALSRHSMPSLFFTPESWQTFSIANLTPWLLLSYRVDWGLFGLQPTLFYLHQLLALTLTGVLLYSCLRLWFRRGFALAGCLLFFTGTPIAYLTQQLMTRHYLEGALFSLLAFYCFVRFLRGEGGRGFLVLAACAYLIAVTAKEVYVPLVVLLPFLPIATWQARLRASVPFFVIAVFYALWRGYMLGSVAGGYSGAGLDTGVLLTAATSFAGMPRLLFGEPWWLITALLLLAASVYFVAHPGRLWLALLVVALVLGPLIPLVESPGINSADRYLYVPWLVIVFASTLFAQFVHDRFQIAATAWRTTGGIIVLFVVIAAPLWQTLRAREAVAGVGREFDAHARFIRVQTDQSHYIPSSVLLSSFWFVDGLETLKDQYRGGSSPIPVIDPLFLNQDILSLHVYDRQCNCFVDDSESIPRRLAEFKAQHRPRAALNLQIGYSNRLFTWQLGPYDTGSWHFLSKELGTAAVPPAGSLRLYMEDGSLLYLRYTSPDGWVTYSDGLVIAHPMQAMTWTRE